VVPVLPAWLPGVWHSAKKLQEKLFFFLTNLCRVLALGKEIFFFKKSLPSAADVGTQQSRRQTWCWNKICRVLVWHSAKNSLPSQSLPSANGPLPSALGTR
jgi:hypothetical protein